jgi:hypothetical protein
LAEENIPVDTSSRTLVGIVGAGPYGVSIAAYLRYVGINFRIFGSPMRRWLSQMPKQMLLKSESSCASSLYEPTGLHTLAHFCSEKGISCPDLGTPVSRELFVKYALWFQQTLVPDVEDVVVTSVRKLGDRFELRLNGGETLDVGKVIVATGLDHMAYIPEQIAQLPTELRSHTADYYDFSRFKGNDVIVIGAGQSALEAAAILNEEGASVRILVREPRVIWNPVRPLVHRSFYQRLRKPRTRFGDGLGHWVYDNIPGVFRYLPQHIRLEKVRTALGPAGARWLKDRIIGKVPTLVSHQVRGAVARNGRVTLQLTDANGKLQEIVTDHVIAATGYKFNFQYLPFLDQAIKLQLKHEQQSPRLSSNFESSVPGLYFTSLGSANSFGPAMRFLAGADYTARRISSQLVRGQNLRIRSFAPSEKCPEF